MKNKLIALSVFIVLMSGERADALILNQSQASIKPLTNVVPPLGLQSDGTLSLKGADGTVLGGAAATPTQQPVLGSPSSGIGGALTLRGSGTGSAVIAPPANGNATVIQLPPDNGQAGYVLTTDGAGHWSWAQVGTTTASKFRVTLSGDHRVTLSGTRRITQ